MVLKKLVKIGGYMPLIESFNPFVQRPIINDTELVKIFVDKLISKQIDIFSNIL